MDFCTGKRIFKKFLGLLVIVTVTYLNIECKNQETNRCISKETCGKCIEEDPRCAWCSETNITKLNTTTRCNLLEELQGKCEDLIYPANSIKHIRNVELTDEKRGATHEEAVQIKPQSIKIKLRPNLPETFQLYFRQAVDYPVDLYYLMDLSHSMKDDKESLALLGTRFAEEMKTITSNFRLGFGSFVDKVAAPYVAVHPAMLKAPCTGCAPPYGFRNHMPLSSETEKFAKEVHDSKVSGNLDSPEGTMDAIMQAVVCKEEIGWRPKSRKLLVVSTDNDYHYAGDGKLGGIVQPNDCDCHLDVRGYYTKGTEQDYPSLSQINRKIKENNVNLIFAVTRDQVDHYRNLSRRLVGSTTGMLAEDSSNVVQLIRQQYEAISSSVEMTDTAQGSGNIEVSYSSACLDGVMKERNVCKGLKVLDTVAFNVSIKFRFCPSNREDWNQRVKIHPVGLSEYLTVDLEMMCECECEQFEMEERNSSKCSAGNGTYECGVCSCYENHYGRECECDGTESTSDADDTACKLDANSATCSNKGQCSCGKCYCYERENQKDKIYGKYCECNDLGCYNVDNVKCSGHGWCDCGKCKCFKGWSEDDCACSDSIQECLDNDGKLCGEKGKCKCGSCQCEDTYYGQFCDDCPSCRGKCVEYSTCVECFLSSKTEDKELRRQECKACKLMAVELVDAIEVNDTQSERSCTLKDHDSCSMSFKYKMDENNRAVIYTLKEKVCPVPVSMMAFVYGISGSIVAGGVLLLLMWKLLTTIHDRRELAKFEKERQKAKWDSGQNPIYVEPSQTFQNPAYGGE